MLLGKRRRSDENPQTRAAREPQHNSKSSSVSVDDEDEVHQKMPDDAQVAIELLLNSAASAAKAKANEDGVQETPPPPVVLPSQVYALIQNRTAADRAMQRLVEQKKLRRVRLQGPHGEDALVKLSDVYDAVEQVKAECTGDDSKQLVLDAFLQKLVLAKCEPALHREDAKRALQAHIADRVDSENAIAFLTRNGFLSNEVCGNRVLISVPSLGKAVKSVLSGRRELKATLERKRRKYATMKELYKSKAPAGSSTFFDLTFHVRDLQGKGIIAIENMPSGKLLRITQS